MIRVGILGMASIAVKRMIPAIAKDEGFELKYIAVAKPQERGLGDDPAPAGDGTPGNKAGDETGDMAGKITRVAEYADTVGAECIPGYEELLKRSEVDMVYIPLPPALHYKWAVKALECGKDVILEKPFTTSLADTEEIVALARKAGRVVVENYGFVDHNQVGLIKKLLDEGAIGETALVRASFGFPHRAADDFRYDHQMGGGALLDCGGYTLKAASLFLGNSIRMLGSSLRITEGHEVDVYGNALLVNDDGVNASVSFGMDNSYKCELEIWGSQGTITAGRFFTAPDGFEAPVVLKKNNGETVSYTAADDQFLRLLEQYKNCVEDADYYSDNLRSILLQASLVEECGKRVY